MRLSIPIAARKCAVLKGNSVFDLLDVFQA